MDVLGHILPPGDSPPKIRVPSLASHSVDDGSLADFPRRKGFAMHEQNGQLELELSTDHTYAEYTDVLQSWLFFDFIHMFYRSLGLTIDLSEFIIFPVDGESEITAATLRNSFLTQYRLQRKGQIAARATHWWKPKFTKLWSPNDRPLGDQIALDALTDRTPACSRGLREAIDLALHHVNLFDFADSDGSTTSKDRALRSRNRGLVTLSIKYLLCQVVTLIHLETQCEIPGPYLAPDDASKQHEEFETHRLLCVDNRETPPPSAGTMQSYLENNGWCPVLARDLLCRRPLSHVYHAAAAIRYDQNFAAHDQCSDSRGCVASNINLDDFEPKHVENGCVCLPVKPDIEKVYDILQRNEIPIARLSRDRTNRTVIDIVAARPDLSYTAISHVWADGLANAKYNGVFECQLDKLFETVWRMQIESKHPDSHGRYRMTYLDYPIVHVRQPAYIQLLLRAVSSMRVAIWVDAICVPVLDSDDLVRSRAMKMRAINLMTPTYAGASHVLVLDRRVEKLSGRKVLKSAQRFRFVNSRKAYQSLGEYQKHLEILMRYSSWMSRCWTLQEGALARNLFIQCSDGAVYLPYNLRPDVDPKGTQKLIESLLSRSTSMKADLDQILANSSQLDASELAQCSPSDRVKAFLLAKGNPFPMSLLLRRLEEIPDKPLEEWWIPDLQSRASFFSSGWQSTNIATLCDRGVLIRGGRNSFWHEETYEIRPYSIQSTDANKTFWLEKEGKMLWIMLDLGIDTFAKPATTSAGPDLVLLLPGESLCRNARGFIGRGLCLTRTRREQTHLTVHGSEDTIKAWPTLYNYALSMGTQTPLSAVEYAEAPVLRPYRFHSTNEEDQSFLIETDTVSWPRMHAVRGAKNSWFKTSIVHDVLKLLTQTPFSVIMVFFGFCGCLTLLSVKERGIRALRFIIVPMICLSVGTVGSARAMVVRRHNLRSRQRAFEEWVQSFSANRQQQSSNEQPHA